MALGRDRWGTDNHHAAGSAVIAYLNRVTRPLISQYVLERLPSGIKKGTFISSQSLRIKHLRQIFSILRRTIEPTVQERTPGAGG